MGTISAPLCFNAIVPERGYGGQAIQFYGAPFSSTVDYYVKFGELEPTKVIRRNAGLLAGVVPERGKIGPVPVDIVTREGNLLCRVRHRFDYIARGCKDA